MVDAHLEQLKKTKKRKSEVAENDEGKVKKVKKAKSKEADVEEGGKTLKVNPRVKTVQKKKFFRDKPEKADDDDSAKKEKKAAKKALKEKTEKEEKLARRAERNENKEKAEKDQKKEKVKTKVSISLPVGEGKGGEEVERAPAGKGPKIIIAKENKKEKKLSKREAKKARKEAGSTCSGQGSSEELKGRAKALAYLATWAGDRDSWKFEKCRQIWLINHAFDPVIPDTSFPSLVQYLDSIKGGMRQQVVAAATARVRGYVSQQEQQSGEEEEAKLEGEKVSEAASDRALQVLEALKEEEEEEDDDDSES